MLFGETKLQGAYIVDLEAHVDERGSFARCFCEREFAARGLPIRFPQCNLSRNTRAGTLRGMHYQAAPYGEGKLIRAVSGAVYDVIVDIRPGSRTRFQWLGVELSAATGRALNVPEGFAHGFLTLEDGTDVLYHMTEFYLPVAARGFRWNDVRFGIKWPSEPAVIAPRDATYPDYDASGVDG